MLHSSNIILRFITLTSFLELWIFLFSILLMLSSGANIEGIWPKESTDLLFKFWNIFLLECIRQDFNSKCHHCLIKCLITFLIFENLGFKLHETVCIFHSLTSDWCIWKHYPWILICHLFCLFKQLFLLRWKYLRNW